jgi:hypothetical protein
MAFLLIPLIYVTRLLIRAYLGAKTSELLQESAARVS